MKRILFVILLTGIIISCEKESLNVDGSPQIGGNKYTNLITLPNGMKVRILDGKYVYQGDIILSDEQIKMAQIPTTKSGSINNFIQWLWPSNVIHYSTASNLYNVNVIYAAIARWEATTSIDFVEVTNPTGDYIDFVTGYTSVSYSYMGHVGGRQPIELGQGFDTTNVMHEIGHALGLIHEHNRQDRDCYITVNTNNINPYFINQFDKNYLWPNSLMIGDFDFNSVMIYNSYDFSINGLPTIIKYDNSIISRNLTLSSGDIDAIKKLYGSPYMKLVKTVEYENIQMTDYSYIKEVNTSDSIFFYSDINCTNRITLTQPRIAEILQTDYSLSGPVETLHYINIPAGINSYFVDNCSYREWEYMGNKELWEGRILQLTHK